MKIKLISEIEVGDIVLEHGMRLLIVTAPRISEGHGAPRTGQADNGVCRYTKAVVLNADDPAVDDLARSFVRQDHGRWSVQSNDLVRWTVEDQGNDDVSRHEDSVLFIEHVYGGGLVAKNFPQAVLDAGPRAVYALDLLSDDLYNQGAVTKGSPARAWTWLRGYGSDDAMTEAEAIAWLVA